MTRIIAAALLIASAAAAAAQDVRGLERCMAEKQIERRTGCLQANTEYLQQELVKLRRDTDAKLSAASRELAAARGEAASLKALLAKLETEVAHLKTRSEPARSEPAKK